MYADVQLGNVGNQTSPITYVLYWNRNSELEAKPKSSYPLGMSGQGRKIFGYEIFIDNDLINNMGV